MFFYDECEDRQVKPFDNAWSSSFTKNLNNPDMSDVILKVIDEDTSEEFFAHKVILGTFFSITRFLINNRNSQ